MRDRGRVQRPDVETPGPVAPTRDSFRVCIVAPGPFYGRAGWARPAFSPGAYHVKLDGERIELMFYRGRHATGNEFEPCK